MNSKQEALDFLESLKIENDKPKKESTNSNTNPMGSVPNQSIPPTTQFKPMPRPFRPVSSGLSTGNGIGPGTAPTTPSNIPTGPTGPSNNITPPLPGFKPVRPPTFTPGTPPKPSVAPPPVTGNSQQRVKPTRVFQSFSPKPSNNNPIQTEIGSNSVQDPQHLQSQFQQAPPQSQPYQLNNQSEPYQNKSQSQYQPVPLQQPVYQTSPQKQPQQQTQQGNEWWGSLLTTAQKGLQGVKGLAAEGARVVKESGVDKQIMGLVAPPSSEIDPNLKPVKLWFCPSYDIAISEPLIRICKQSIAESWRAIFSTTSVNFVDDTNYSIAPTLQDAITISETKLEKLQKLSQGDLTSPKPIDAYLTLQPFYTTLNSSLFGETRVIQFWCVLLAEMDIGLVHASAISQSFGERNEEWVTEMAGKVCQTVISDLVEEFERFSKEPLV